MLICAGSSTPAPLCTGSTHSHSPDDWSRASMPKPGLYYLSQLKWGACLFETGCPVFDDPFTVDNEDINRTLPSKLLKLQFGHWRCKLYMVSKNLFPHLIIISYRFSNESSKLTAQVYKVYLSTFTTKKNGTVYTTNDDMLCQNTKKMKCRVFDFQKKRLYSIFCYLKFYTIQLCQPYPEFHPFYRYILDCISLVSWTKGRLGFNPNTESGK